MKTTAEKPKYSVFALSLYKLYSLVRRSGLLETALMKRIFQETYFLYKRYTEDPYYLFCKNYPRLFTGSSILDIGANCGYTALVFAEACGDRSGEIFAFEPEPANLAILKSVVRRKKLQSQVHIIEAAVGAEDGALQLWKNPDHHADNRIITDAFMMTNGAVRDNAVSVSVVSIDSFLEKNPLAKPLTFVKIDVQGFENAVIRGMFNTLKNNEDLTVALEYCPAQIEELGFSPSEIFETFKALGFSWSIIEKNGLLSEFSRERLEEIVAKRGYTDLLASRRPVSR